MRRIANGFTLIELIMTMIIIGVLSVLALPRIDTSGYQAIAFHEKTVAALRYAQKTATSHRRMVCATFPYNYTLELTIDTDKNDVCDTPLLIPGAINHQVISGDSFNAIFNPLPTIFYFAPNGTSTDQILKIVGADNITVVGSTGHVH